MSKERDHSIDGMKGTLVALMILAHIIQFFTGNKYLQQLSFYANLTTFSGFMFTFGYVCYDAYISRDMPTSVLGKKLGRNFLKTMGAYYISAIANAILTTNDFSLSMLGKILLLRHTPAFSEFLPSFAFIYVLIFILRPLLKKASGPWIGIFSVISLLATFINYNSIKSPVLGILIGTTDFPCFPIIQYSAYFLVGMYLASEKKVNMLLYIVSALGTIAFIAYYRYFSHAPNRFPPSILWIIGGGFFVLLYFVLWKKLFKNTPPPEKLPVLCIIGKNTLLYLVFSNVVIFALYRSRITSLFCNPILKAVFFAICFFLCIIPPYLYQKLIRKK